VVHVASSRRLRRGQVKDRRVVATDCVRLCYPYFASSRFNIFPIHDLVPVFDLLSRSLFCSVSHLDFLFSGSIFRGIAGL
jgi:hypothetical protein